MLPSRCYSTTPTTSSKVRGQRGSRGRYCCPVVTERYDARELPRTLSYAMEC